MNVIYCNDGCQKDFYITELKTEGIEKLPGNVERHYIECPNCGQQYTSYYLNDDMKKIQQEISVLRKKLPDLKLKQKNKLNKLSRRLQFMNNKLKTEIEQGEINAGKS
ncbi:hypothetical protein [Pseudogracilibacillus auburnensis]|uniref:hypothetical protein n=1 Tax=Pseudogracilibacillus auburnensis TaxID=1494959 RepID=UPI001A97BC8D|nr:hypothetical protein [Pseudogracilibacillus auburnensis]MBO1003750.1 hypothetical protein [Pseudogracilibacillus auburnensis]